MPWEYGSEVRLAQEALDRAQVPQKERATRAAGGEQGLMTPMSFVSGRGGKGVIPKPKLGGVQGVLARTFAWAENLAKMHEAFSIVALILICLRELLRCLHSWTRQPDL